MGRGIIGPASRSTFPGTVKCSKNLRVMDTLGNGLFIAKSERYVTLKLSNFLPLLWLEKCFVSGKV